MKISSYGPLSPQPPTNAAASFRQQTSSATADVLTVSGAHFFPSFESHRLPRALKKRAPGSTPTLDAAKLKALHDRPATEVMRSSPLALQAYAFDLDYPALRAHARERCKEVLAAMNRADLDPDHLMLKVLINDPPVASSPGMIGKTRQLSMTQLALLSLSKKTWSGLSSRILAANPQPEETIAEVLIKETAHGHIKGADMTLHQLIEAVDNTRIGETYSHRLKAFWNKHARTYQALAKLAYADSLAEQVEQNTISPEGHGLALEAANLGITLPSYSQLLERHKRNNSFVSSVRHKGRILSGIVQISSTISSKTLIYIPGHSPAFLEFDSPAAARQGFEALLNIPASRKSLAPYLKAARRRAPHPDDQKPQATPAGLFEHVSAGLLRSSLRSLDRKDSLDSPWLKANNANEVFEPINRALAMIGSTDTWVMRHDLIKRLPSPMRLARRYMRKQLARLYPGNLLPNQTFIQYLPGPSRTSLGGPVAPFASVPSEKPLSMTQALLDNYRVQTPSGYRDKGGRTVVFIDKTGQGHYTPGSELPIKPQDIADLVAKARFAGHYNDALSTFWTDNGAQLEHYQQCLLNSQAIDSLQSKTLSTAGLELVAGAAMRTSSGEADKQRLDTASNTGVFAGKPDTVRVNALGFGIADSLLNGVEQHTSPGLIEFSTPDSPLVVLYEAAGNPAYHEFKNRQAMTAYIQQATTRPVWREDFLRSVPRKNRAKVESILKKWAAEPSPLTPSSFAPLLSPFIDGAAVQASRQVLGRTPVSGSLPAFIVATCKATLAADAQEMITTNAELTARLWREQLEKLQLVLFPIALVFPPAAAGSLAVGGLQLGLSLYTALSPESSSKDRDRASRDAILSGLSAIPAAHHIAKAFKKYAVASRLLLSEPKLLSHLRIYKGDKQLAQWLLSRSKMLGKNPNHHVKNLSEVKKYDFEIPAVVYRAHIGTHTATEGLRRAPSAAAIGDDYLAAIIKHTAGTAGTKGQVLSLARERGTAINFAKGRIIYSIDVTRAPPGSFRTAANILLDDGPRLVEEGRITRATLIRAVDNLQQHVENELFYIGGDIPAKYLI